MRCQFGHGIGEESREKKMILELGVVNYVDKGKNEESKLLRMLSNWYLWTLLMWIFEEYIRTYENDEKGWWFWRSSVCFDEIKSHMSHNKYEKICEWISYFYINFSFHSKFI